MKDFEPPSPSGAKRPHRRSDEAPVPLDSVAPPVVAGPRPLSDRQHSHRRRATGPPPTAVLPVPPASEVFGPADDPALARRKIGKRQARANHLLARRRNRIRPNYGRAALRFSLFLLGAVSLTALFFSPQLWVRRVRIEGLQTISAARVVARLGLKPRTNLVLLPVARLQKAVESEPAVARARIRRVPPDGFLVSVEERRPVAVVQMENNFYTIDRTLVAFRKDEFAPPGLPLIVLSPTVEGAAQNEQEHRVALGKQMLAPGLAEASKCLSWALDQANKFPLERVVVDPLGGLCLNRKGGMEVRLGTGTDLDKKLDVLDVLLVRRDDVQAGDVSYVNLFAYDAPAVLTREAALNVSNAAPRNEP